MGQKSACFDIQNSLELPFQQFWRFLHQPFFEKNNSVETIETIALFA